MDRIGSIKENPLSPRLPDFCNLGTWLRVVLAANGLGLVAALLRSRELAALPNEFLDISVLLEPVLLASLLVLCLARRWLRRLTPAQAVLAVALTVMLLAAFYGMLLAPFSLDPVSLWRAPFWAGLTATVLIVWFDLQTRARSPAVAEARLMALTSRIRPHFLFNSLNAVLGVIRSDPRRAEAALEELADLFRVLMKENRDLVPLSDEIALARQYLGLERLRLGERLQVRWDVASCPPDALVPPLMLQPLLENAVYHGIEPLEGPGEILIRLAREQQRLLIEIDNPCVRQAPGVGNQMALANIRERLLLFFDLEAELETKATPGHYRVSIVLPYRASGSGV